MGELIAKSPELEAVATRWLKALQNKDREALTNLFSKSECLRYIGSDLHEVWSGQVVRDGYADHAEEIPELTLTPDGIEAFEHGDAGWAYGAVEVKLIETGAQFTQRFTWVFALEEGAWKIIQTHVSNPRSTFELIGIEHTAFNRLIESAKENFTFDGSEGTATVMFTDIANSTSIARPE